MRSLLLVVFLLFSCSGKKPPVVANGVLDLSWWNFKKNGTLKIKGPWKKSISKSEKKINPQYTLKIKGVKEKELGIFSEGKNLGYSLFKVEKKSVTKIFNVINEYKKVRNSFSVNDDFSFLIHVFNDNNQLPVLILGSKKEIYKNYDYLYFLNIFAAGILFCSFLYNLVFYYQRKDKVNLYAASFSGLFFLRLFVENSWIFSEPSDLIYELKLKLDILTFIFISPILLNLANEVFSGQFKKFKGVVYYPSFLFLPIVIFFTGRIYNEPYFLIVFKGIIGLVSFYILIKNIEFVLKGFPFSKIVLISSGLLAISAILDYPTFYVFCLVQFVLTQTFLKNLKVIKLENGNKELEMRQNIMLELQKTLQIQTEKNNELIDIEKKKLEKNKREINGLLDHMETALFCIGPKFEVFSPVSKYTQNIFGENIIGKNVLDFLFFNIRRGTKSYSDMLTVFAIIYGSDEIQYFGLEDNLPKTVTLPDKDNIKGKILKLSYAPFYDEEGLVEKILCMAIDVTESEKHLKNAEEDQENYKFMTEIIEIENKEEIAKKLEYFIKKDFEILEDFVSPMSDTYNADYFHSNLQKAIKEVKINIKGLKNLELLFDKYLYSLEKFNKVSYYGINPQNEGASTICDILDTLLKYADCLNRFTDVNLNFNFSYNDLILEKVQDIEKIYKNLFEYGFLVKDINNLEVDNIQKILSRAQLYPDFEKTIGLIQQRSRHVSFLFKGIMESNLSAIYDNVSLQVQQVPDRTRLTEFVFQHNLLETYKLILEENRGLEDHLQQKGKK
ncbi:7TM-DISM domain-containing protein [Bacteriovoracales bacterium]|nr:7TM-DISM domain-containing protein [Bacteriovoracales bacterium]